MAKVVVITDSKGKVLGSVRGDPITTDSGTIEFRRPPAADVNYHELHVPEDVLTLSAAERHTKLAQLLKS
jgi:hypothetical protein